MIDRSDRHRFRIRTLWAIIALSCSSLVLFVVTILTTTTSNLYLLSRIDVSFLTYSSLLPLLAPKVTYKSLVTKYYMLRGRGAGGKTLHNHDDWKKRPFL
jgi:hypothetical protein